MRENICHLRKVITEKMITHIAVKYNIVFIVQKSRLASDQSRIKTSYNKRAKKKHGLFSGGVIMYNSS